MTLLNLAEAHEDDESYMSPLDLLFHEIESGQSYQKVSDKAFSFDADVRGFANGTDTGYAWVKTGTPTKPEDDFSLNNEYDKALRIVIPPINLLSQFLNCAPYNLSIFSSLKTEPLPNVS